MMPQYKELFEDCRLSVIETHEAGKGNKRIAKDLGVHQATVQQMENIQNCCYYPLDQVSC